MGRNKRIKIRGRKAGFHLITRVHKREHLLNDHMKNFFVQTLRRLNELFFVEISNWAVLENHFHVLCRYEDYRKVDPDSAIFRWNRYHPKHYHKSRLSDAHRAYVRRALSDVSFFMKKLNTLLTREYNRMTGSVGTLWERRFRSSIVERGKAMMLTGAYIDLNSFRASITAKPEDYRYSSLWWLRKGNRDDLVATEVYDEYFHISRKQGLSDKLKRNISKPKYKKERKMYLEAMYEKYLKFVYKEGTRAPKRKLIHGKTDSIKITEAMQKKLDAQFKSKSKSGSDPDTDAEYGDESSRPRTLQKGVGLCKKVWTFTQGKFIGSRDFAQAFYTGHVNPGYTKKAEAKHRSKWIHGMAGGLWGVFNGSRKAREEIDNQGSRTNKGSGDSPPI